MIAPLLQLATLLLAPTPLAAGAGGADRLEELIAASRSIETYSARYSLSFELHPGVEVPRPPDGTIRIDQDGTRGVRVERTAGDEVLLLWCNASTMATQMRSLAGERFGRLEVGALNAQAAQLRERLKELFPGGSRDEQAHNWAGPVAVVGWSFNDQARRANFEVNVATSGSVVSPLGWLDTLRGKDGALVQDGERLRFESDDGHFRGALRALDGVLETLVGESPNGRFTLALLSFSREPADAELFELPALAPPGARDVSSELRRSVLSLLHLRLRVGGYRAVARCESLDEACAANASSWLADFHEFVILSNLAPWFDLLEKRRATLVERLKAYATSGRTKSQVEEQRQRELASLAKGVDEIAKTFDDLVKPLMMSGAPRHAPEFHQLEQRSFATTFDRLVRRKVLAEFEAATKLE